MPKEIYAETKKVDEQTSDIVEISSDADARSAASEPRTSEHSISPLYTPYVCQLLTLFKFRML